MISESWISNLSKSTCYTENPYLPIIDTISQVIHSQMLEDSKKNEGHIDSKSKLYYFYEERYFKDEMTKA